MTAEGAPQPKERYPIIGIVGPLASGKSTLGEFIAQGWGVDGFGVDHVEEKFAENPYLDGFYNSPSGGLALPSEEFFLREKVKQLRGLVGTGAFYTKCQVIDPDLEMDRLYAKVFYRMGWLTKSELGTYENLFACLLEASKIPVPDIYITLNASPKTLMERVLKRGRKYELTILEKYPEYFIHLSQEVLAWHDSVLRTKGAPGVFLVDTGSRRYDFALEKDEDERKAVLEDILDEVGNWTRYYLIDRAKEKSYDGSTLILPDGIRRVETRVVGK